jgi:hypothetical protein
MFLYSTPLYNTITSQIFILHNILEYYMGKLTAGAVGL